MSAGNDFNKRNIAEFRANHAADQHHVVSGRRRPVSVVRLQCRW
jgi:hypothetical protein